MNAINVLDETGNDTRLAEQIHTMIAEAAPLVEKIAELSLPPTITYRLMSPEAWAQELSTCFYRQVLRETSGRALTSWEQRVIPRLPHGFRRAFLYAWVTEDAQVVTNRLLQPEVLLVPAALRHQGLLGAPDALCEKMVRPLVLMAQIAASQGAVAPARQWPISAQVPGHPVRRLLEGHAIWVSRQVAPLMLGSSSEERRRLHRSRFFWRRHILNLVVSQGRDLRYRKQGAWLVEQVVSGCGVERFNEVWTDPRLVPTFREFTRPHEWLQRLP
ncbi:zinc-dependent metalloprotease [Streptomyces sparsogenes]|uniref:zinc-dependent metalloprotease n=1 Tax=Streptomyces sparsogenes TaxID=67365 RepID=UPI00384D9652